MLLNCKAQCLAKANRNLFNLAYTEFLHKTCAVMRLTFQTGRFAALFQSWKDLMQVCQLLPEDLQTDCLQQISAYSKLRSLKHLLCSAFKQYDQFWNSLALLCDQVSSHPITAFKPYLTGLCGVSSQWTNSCHHTPPVQAQKSSPYLDGPFLGIPKLCPGATELRVAWHCLVCLNSHLYSPHVRTI